MAFAECEKQTEWEDNFVEFYDRRNEGIAYWIAEIAEIKRRKESEDRQEKRKKRELYAWKIIDDQIVPWDLATKGFFFSDEVYIVLNRTDIQSTKVPERRLQTPDDIYCWVGKSASHHSYRTGLYNAVALDEALEGVAIVHREVQDFESKRFLNGFEFYTVLKGRSDGLDNCDLHTKYKKRLLRVTGPLGGTLCIRETSMKRGAMRESKDLFILDKGLTIYVWVGSGLTDSELKVKRAKEYAEGIKAERKDRGIRVGTVHENDETLDKTHELYWEFPYQAKKPIQAKKWKPPQQPQRESGPGLHVFLGQKLNRKMFQVRLLNPVARRDHDFRFQEKCQGEDVCLRLMDSKEVYVVHVKDSEEHVFIRVGKSSWIREKGNGLIVGHDYLKDEELTFERHSGIPITVVKEEQFSIQLQAAIGI